MTLLLVTSPKGGVGVTTIAAEIARRVARAGRDVVAVNLTDQAAMGYRLKGADALGSEYYDDSHSTGPLYLQVDEAVPCGQARADFALAQGRENVIVIVDVAAGDRETRYALTPSADLVLCVLAADAGSLAVLPQATQHRGATPYCVLNLVDERRDRVQLRFDPGGITTTRRQRVGDRLPHHPPVHTEFRRNTGDRADTKLMLLTKLLEQFHSGVPIHSKPPGKTGKTVG